MKLISDMLDLSTRTVLYCEEQVHLPESWLLAWFKKAQFNSCHFLNHVPFLFVSPSFHGDICSDKDGRQLLRSDPSPTMVAV